MDTQNTHNTSFSNTDANILREALEALSEGIAVFNSDRHLVSCNERFVEMLAPIAGLISPGLRWEDMLQACVTDGLYADASGRDSEWLANVGSGSPTGEVEIALADGSIHSVRYNPTTSGGFVVVRTDITDKRRAEQRLSNSEELLRTILDANPAAIVMARLADGKILYRSPAAFELFGQTTYAREHYADPADRDEYVRLLRKQGRVDDYRLTFRNPEGQVFPMSSNGLVTEYNGEICAVSTLIDLKDRTARDAIIRKVIESCPAPILMTEAETGKVLFRSPELDRMFGACENTPSFYVDSEDRNAFLRDLRRDGSVTDYKSRFRNATGQPFWGAISARLITYEDQEMIVSYSRDITEQLELEVELSRQRERLFQNEKMSALGGLLANVAHALNNPLSVVVGHALMLREETDDPDVVRQIGKISEAADRCTDIIKTYLSMARQEPLELLPIDINDVVATAVDVTNHGPGPHLTDVSFAAESGLPDVQADGDQLAQVIVNLLQNATAAIEATERKGRIRIETRSLPGRSSVQIIIEDTGPGVSRDMAQQIFEPFFTTKGVGNGKGIGLAYCHRVIQTHNGQIRLDPEYRDGARFLIDLPVAADASGPTDTQQSDGEPAAARTILVIDDEPDVAELNGEVLERVGYVVRVAYSGAEAIELMAREQFDCVLSDLNMPDVDGRGFFELIRRDHPELLRRTGFITGDTMGRASQGFLKDSGRPFLEKPVSPNELRAFVAEILSDGGTS